MKLDTFMVITFVVVPVLFLAWLCFLVYGPWLIDKLTGDRR